MPEQGDMLVMGIVFVIAGVTMVYSFTHLLLVIGMLVYCTAIFTISAEFITMTVMRVLQAVFVIAGLLNLNAFGVGAISYVCTLVGFVVVTLGMQTERFDRGAIYLAMICLAAVAIKQVRWYYYLVPIICGMTNAAVVAGLLVRYEFD